jgi:hypothetical protein
MQTRKLRVRTGSELAKIIGASVVTDRLREPHGIHDPAFTDRVSSLCELQTAQQYCAVSIWSGPCISERRRLSLSSLLKCGTRPLPGQSIADGGYGGLRFHAGSGGSEGAAVGSVGTGELLETSIFLAKALGERGEIETWQSTTPPRW